MGEFLVKRAVRMMPPGVRKAAENIDFASKSSVGIVKKIEGGTYASATVNTPDIPQITGSVVRGSDGHISEIAVSTAAQGKFETIVYYPGTLLKRRRVVTQYHSGDATVRHEIERGRRIWKGTLNAMELNSNLLKDEAIKADAK